MINLKETISFKTLREKGPKAIEVKDDEVIQVVARNSDIKVILSQDYFLRLLSAYNKLLIQSGEKKEEIIEVRLEERLGELEERFTKIAKLVNEEEESPKWQGGQKKAGRF